VDLSPLTIDPRYLYDFTCYKYLKLTTVLLDQFVSLNILNI